ncbi:MAG: TlpA disulfide reductase family protein [Desulfomonilia bacterium]|jgi:peroxiredoxin|nr:TlpA family protein disulfide reductase [Deltaproteobacteria bacterium]MDX9760595.1 TlpA disulfide reductase family protein [Desulfomonilia bacterium]HPW68813.1 TlpA disulfide reductase family protein [Deltaproteobacteria bacterium]
MMRKILVCSVLLLVVFLPIASCDEGTSREKAGATEANLGQAPGFSLRDLSGKTFHLEDYRGKVVLVNFTTTWCPYCKKDVPDLKRMYDRYKGRNFEILSVYIQESRDKVSSFAQKYELPFPVLLDTEGFASSRYGVRGVPTKVVIAPDGSIVCWMCGDVEKVVEKLLGQG